MAVRKLESQRLKFYGPMSPGTPLSALAREPDHTSQRRSHMQPRLATLALVPLLALAACGQETGPEARPVSSAPTTAVPTTPTDPTPDPELRYDPVEARAALDAARERWAATNWTAYRFTFTPSCYCPQDDVTVAVIGGRPVGTDAAGHVWSVEQWFGEIDAAIGKAADVRVAYGETGAPSSLYIDVDEMIADEEFGYELVDLEPVTDPLETLLVDEYGCGFGFASADGDQTVSMVVRFVDVDWETGPEPGRYDLADLAGTVYLGADLMANWCNDVVIEGQPEPVIDDTWSIVGGSVDVSIDNRLAVGVFTDVVAVDADGDERHLGDIEVSNGMWGFFAG